MRVVQVSDSHVSAGRGVQPPLQRVLDTIANDPPDLVVHTGDVVWEDPDNADDRRFARDVFAALPCPVRAVPGNHDVGFFEPDHLQRRLAAFRHTWGDDRFVIDDPATGWRLVGLDAYALGHADNDQWVTDAIHSSSPLAVFIHQPLVGDIEDGWQFPQATADGWINLLAGAEIAVIASGHRHCAALIVDERGVPNVWAPSTTLTGDRAHHGGDPRPGAVEFVFHADGGFDHRVIASSPL